MSDANQHPHRRCTDILGEAVCPVHNTFAAGLQEDIQELKANTREVRDGVERIEGVLGKGNVRFENLSVRLDHVEKVVYGAVALALSALGVAILSMVIKGGG